MWPQDLRTLQRQAVTRLHGVLQEDTWERYLKEHGLFMRWRAAQPALAQADLSMALVLYGEMVAQTRSVGVAHKVMIMVCRVQQLGLEPITESPALRQLMAALEKEAKRNATPLRVDALDPKWLSVWFNACGGSWELLGQARRGMLAGLLLGLRGAKRAADMARVRVQDIRKLPDTVDWLEVTFPRTKNHPEGEIVVIEPVQGGNQTLCPARRVWQWREERVAQGASAADLLFVSATGKSVGADYWTRAVRMVAAAAGVKGRFSSRSLRVGGATAMLRAGYTAEETRAVGGWKSDAYMTYLRGNAVAQSGLSTTMFGGRTSGIRVRGLDE